MRTFGSYENEVPLCQQELDLIDASVLNQCFQITLECRDSIPDAGLVTDATISRKVLRDFTVISRDVNSLVVAPDDRLVLLCIL